jgi:hypothetical protein
VGLWANTAAMIIKPATAAPDEAVVWLGKITLEMQAIKADFHQLIAGGFDCKNPKLCRE